MTELAPATEKRTLARRRANILGVGVAIQEARGMGRASVGRKLGCEPQRVIRPAAVGSSRRQARAAIRDPLSAELRRHRRVQFSSGQSRARARRVCQSSLRLSIATPNYTTAACEPSTLLLNYTTRHHGRRRGTPEGTPRLKELQSLRQHPAGAPPSKPRKHRWSFHSRDPTPDSFRTPGQRCQREGRRLCNPFRGWRCARQRSRPRCCTPAVVRGPAHRDQEPGRKVCIRPQQSPTSC